MNGNALAWAALACWPLVALIAYAVRRPRARMARTTAWMMFLPALFLPSNIALKTPGIPALDKHRIAFLSIAVALQLFHRRELLARAPGHQFPRLIMAALFFGVVQTVRTNQDILVFGPTVLPGLSNYDILSITGAQVLDLYLPFAIGQRVFRNERDLRDLLDVLSLCALLYAPFILVELRLSPQFHNWVYGYHPSDFIQTVRGDGFRPMVFMNHGLALAMFLFGCLCAALALNTARVSTGRFTPKIRAAAIATLVLLCKSMWAIVYATVARGLRLVSWNKAIGWLALALAAIVVAYPATRAAGVFPVKGVIEAFERIDTERADSLAFRLRNEDALLERALQRPVYGWGTFGRNRIYASWGQDISVTDGYWIILMGSFGYVGFGGFIALLLVPLLRFWWHRDRIPPTSRKLAAALALMVAIFTLDLLPNALLGFLPQAYAGALFTLAGRLRRRAPARAAAASPEPTLPVRRGGPIVVDSRS